MSNYYSQSIYSTGTITYQDLDISMKANPFTGDLRVKTDADAVKQAIATLLYINFGEIPFNPTIGAGLGGLLFEPLDLITQVNLTNAISRCITNFEPRVSIISLQVTEDQANNALAVSLSFNMLNITQPVSINILLQRSR
jgi:phage baseplate assembly protein W